MKCFLCAIESSKLYILIKSHIIIIPSQMMKLKYTGLSYLFTVRQPGRGRSGPVLSTNTLNWVSNLLEYYWGTHRNIKGAGISDWRLSNAQKRCLKPCWLVYCCCRHQTPILSLQMSAPVTRIWLPPLPPSVSPAATVTAVIPES